MPLTAPDHADGRVAIAGGGVAIAATVDASTAVSRRTKRDEVDTRSRLIRAHGRVYRTFVRFLIRASYASRKRDSSAWRGSDDGRLRLVVITSFWEAWARSGVVRAAQTARTYKARDAPSEGSRRWRRRPILVLRSAHLPL
jgi:hypothetical protein